MGAQLDYYFTSISPWVYLGHQAISDVAKKHGITLNIRPVDINRLWKESGSVPLGQRPETRQRYRLVELQRYSHYRNIPITLHPAHFPVDPTLADLTITAVVLNGVNPHDYMARVFASIWAHDEDISKESTLEILLSDSGINGAEILAQARSAECAEIRKTNSAKAINAHAIGVPAYVLNGEVFWGQDRIDMIDHALTTNRKSIHG